MLRGLVGGAIAVAAAACSLTDLSGLVTVTDAADGAVAGNQDASTNDGGPTTVDGGGGGDATTPADPYGDAVLADSPVAYWRFEEDASAMVAMDVIGGRQAKVMGVDSGFGAVGVAGRGVGCPSGCSSFDVGDNFDFAGPTPFTFELWIQPTGGSSTVLRKRTDVEPVQGYILFMKDSSELGFEGWGNSLAAWSDGALSKTSFTHVVVMMYYDNGLGQTRMWINGNEQTGHTGSTMDTLSDTNSPLRFLENYSGYLDEVAIYDKILPAGRIAAHFHASGR